MDSNSYCDKSLVLLNEIEYINIKFVLDSTIAFHVLKKNEHYIISFAPLGIEIIEQTKEDAIECFKEEFAILWKIYAGESDSNLTKDAILLKERLLKYVKEVQKFWAL